MMSGGKCLQSLLTSGQDQCEGGGRINTDRSHAERAACATTGTAITANATNEGTVKAAALGAVVCADRQSRQRLSLAAVPSSRCRWRAPAPAISSVRNRQTT